MTHLGKQNRPIRLFRLSAKMVYSKAKNQLNCGAIAVAQGRKTGGRPFPKGVASNPAGRPAMPEAIKKLQKNSRIVIMEAMCSMILKPVHEIEKIAESRDSASMVALMASVMEKGIKLGCNTRAQFFMNYMIGKPLDFDPSILDEEEGVVEKALETMPSTVLTTALREYSASLKQPAT